MEHYLDNSATTKVCPEAIEAAVNAMEICYGNPSSTHTKGREAKKLLDGARAQVSKALGCKPTELVFSLTFLTICTHSLLLSEFIRICGVHYVTLFN